MCPWGATNASNMPDFITIESRMLEQNFCEGGIMPFACAHLEDTQDFAHCQPNIESSTGSLGHCSATGDNDVTFAEPRWHHQSRAAIILSVSFFEYTGSPF